MNIYCIKNSIYQGSDQRHDGRGVDRADALRNLTEALGGKLLSFYGMVGQYYHVMAISKVPEYANLSAGMSLQ